MNNEVSNNIKEFQTLSKWMPISLFSLLLSVHIILSPFMGSSNKTQHFNSTSKLESMAFQAIELEKMKINLNQGTLVGLRNPASTQGLVNTEGSIGADQNGNSYHYQIRREEKFFRVLVQSAQDSTAQTEVLIPIDNQ